MTLTGRTALEVLAVPRAATGDLDEGIDESTDRRRADAQAEESGLAAAAYLRWQMEAIAVESNRHNLVVDATSNGVVAMRAGPGGAPVLPRTQP